MKASRITLPLSGCTWYRRRASQTCARPRTTNGRQAVSLRPRSRGTSVKRRHAQAAVAARAPASTPRTNRLRSRLPFPHSRTESPRRLTASTTRAADGVRTIGTWNGANAHFGPMSTLLLTVSPPLEHSRTWYRLHIDRQIDRRKRAAALRQASLRESLAAVIPAGETTWLSRFSNSAGQTSVYPIDRLTRTLTNF